MKIILADIILKGRRGPFTVSRVVTLDLPLKYLQHDKYLFGRFMHQTSSYDLKDLVYKGEYPEIVEVRKIKDMGESFASDEEILNSITVPQESEIKAAPKPMRKTKRK